MNVFSFLQKSNGFKWWLPQKRIYFCWKEMIFWKQCNFFHTSLPSYLSVTNSVVFTNIAQYLLGIGIQSLITLTSTVSSAKQAKVKVVLIGPSLKLWTSKGKYHIFRRRILHTHKIWWYTSRWISHMYDTKSMIWHIQNIRRRLSHNQNIWRRISGIRHSRASF